MPTQTDKERVLLVVVEEDLVDRVEDAEPAAMFGRHAGDARWREFLAREVTPRFPDGLTVYETTGQWRDPATKAVTRDRSRVLRIIVPADTARDKIDGVAAAYKTQFAQKSVGIVMRPACVSF